MSQIVTTLRSKETGMMADIALAMWLVAAISIVVFGLIIYLAARGSIGGSLAAAGLTAMLVGLAVIATSAYDAAYGSQVTVAMPTWLTVPLVVGGSALFLIGLCLLPHDLRRWKKRNGAPPAGEHQEVTEQIAGEGTPAIFRS